MEKKDSIIATGKTREGVVFAVKKDAPSGATETNTKLNIQGRLEQDASQSTYIAIAFVNATAQGTIEQSTTSKPLKAQKPYVVFSLQTKDDPTAPVAKKKGDLIVTPSANYALAETDSTGKIIFPVSSKRTLNTGLASLTSLQIATAQIEIYNTSTELCVNHVWQAYKKAVEGENTQAMSCNKMSPFL